MKKLDTRTYEDYISLKKNPTKAFLMISELIDNSISSFDNKFGEDDWGEVLEIEVDFYFDKEKKKKVYHGTKTLVDSYIRVTDNAFGMSESGLIDAIRLNNKNENSISKMNRHGRGLKQCAFYFGTDLDIETWNNNNEISTINLRTSLFNANDEVELESISVTSEDLENLSARGTSITINKIHSNRSLSQNKYERLINAISFRYIKLIKSGKMIIRYTDDIHNKYSKFDKKEEAIEPISLVSDGFGYNLKKINSIIKSSKNVVDNAKKGLESGEGLCDFPKVKKTVDETFKNIKELLLNSISESELEFKWEQTLDINGKKLLVTFWMLKKNNSPYRGYRVYESDRALLHPPMTDDEGGTSTYHKPVFPKNHKSGSTDNRFAGEFNILDINATTSTDKSQFIFEDSEDEEILNLKLRSIWEVFNIFAIKGRSDVSEEKGKTIEKKEQAVIKSVINSKFSGIASDVLVDADKKEITLNLKINKKNNWKIKINIDNQESPNKIWDKSLSEEEDWNMMEITAYSSHPIWQRIDQSTDFIPEALVPITIFIAHYEISNIIDGTSLDDVHVSEIDLSKIDSPIDHLNKSGEIISE